MTRKDYIIIASIIRDMPAHTPSLRAQRESCARTLAEGLAAHHKGPYAFKRELFVLVATGQVPLTARQAR